MNLVEVELTNYRQFSGTHIFSPGEQAMVAILGENGAGKTTLFESIEWCLFAPNAIKRDDIRNRVYPGNPRVRVVLENPTTGERFEIERESKKTTTEAAVYRADNPTAPLVQGTRPVSEYVARQLLGMSHQAFSATFLTRQKELGFFGSLKPTDRRREVGKLLGLETIRTAQEAISKRRLEKQSEARAKTSRVEEVAAERDFEKESTAIDNRIATASLEVGLQQTALASADLRLNNARAAVTRASQRREEHSNLQLVQTKIEGELRRVKSSIESLEKQQHDLDRDAIRLVDLRPIAATESDLIKRMEDHSLALDQRRQRIALTEQITRLDDDLKQVAENVEQIEVQFWDGEQTGLRIAESPPSESTVRLQALLKRAVEADPGGAEATLNHLTACIDAEKGLTAAQTTLKRYEDVIAGIHREIERLLEHGDPADAISALEQQLQEIREQRAADAATNKTATTDRDRLTTMRQRLLEEADDTESCPTCNRPFGPGERDGYLTTLGNQIRELSATITTTSATIESCRTKEKTLDTQLQILAERRTQLDKNRVRLTESKRPMEEATAAVAEAEAILADALQSAGRGSFPSDADIEAARQALDRVRHRAGQSDRIHDLLQQQERCSNSREMATRQLTALGPDTYDQKSHKDDERQLLRVREAVTQIREIEARLLQRPALETSLIDARTEAEKLSESLAGSNSALQAFGFDPDEHPLASAEEATALRSRQDASDRLNSITRELDAAQRDQAQIKKDQDLFERYRVESEAAQAEAERLSRMYTEFNLFDKFVAQSIAPALADLTGQMVAEVTEGKYDRVEFDDDFGVRVFDGNDDSFPLEQFSGGERDVVALCARLALSQLIGGSGHHPLQFVVLDEVFGSLDQVRRQNLMETLQRLVGDGGPFRQLFAISHVDDIQNSPAFDEAWKITEGADGISVLERLSSHPTLAGGQTTID